MYPTLKAIAISAVLPLAFDNYMVLGSLELWCAPSLSNGSQSRRRNFARASPVAEPDLPWPRAADRLAARPCLQQAVVVFVDRYLPRATAATLTLQACRPWKCTPESDDGIAVPRPAAGDTSPRPQR